jgi:uncharacterized RDD family membrane protein YckC
MTWGQSPSEYQNQGSPPQGSPPPNPPPPNPPPPWAPVPPAWQAPRAPLGPAPGVEFAPHGARLIAYIVDGFIIGLPMMIFAVVGVVALMPTAIRSGYGDVEIATSSSLGPIALLFSILFIAVAVFVILYFPWFWVHGGQTPGMRLFGLRVVRDRDGGPIGWGAAILRLIGYWVDAAVFYIGFAWILIDERRRGWHDLIAGTVVIAATRR